MLTFTKHPILDAKAPTDEEIVALATGSQEDKEILKQWHRQHEARVQLAEEDPIRHGFELDHWKYAEELLGQGRDVMCLGGNRCLAGEQEIWDPVAQKSRRVDEIDGDFHVLAYDTATGDVVEAPAEKPYLKPPAELFELTLSNGESFRCSAAHRFATPFGWRSLDECEENDYVFHLQTDSSCASLPSVRQGFDSCHLRSNLGIYLLAFRQGAQRSIQRVQGFLGDCLACLRSRDERPHLSEGAYRAFAPLRGDVQGHKECVFCDLDDLGNISPRSHPYLLSYLLSILCGAFLSVGRFGAFLCRIYGLAWKSPLWSICSRDVLAGCLPRLVESFLRKFSELVLSGLIYLLGLASWFIINRDVPRIVKSKYLRTDDVYDFAVPSTFTYMIGGVPQKNSGKTEFGARAVVKAAIENSNATIICFAQDENASIEVQQSAVYRNLPPEYKKKSKTETEYVNYKVKTGFSGASLILGNGSKILFRKYSQFIANRSAFEGYELGAKNPQWHNIGVWLDEYLEDGDLVETMRFRLATRGAQMLLTFTPIDGYTPFVASYLKDVETKRTAAAELLGGEQVPLIQINSKIDCGIVFFHSILNPFGGYKDIAKRLKHSSRDEILTRAYGIPVKSMTTLFPLFNTNVHVVDEIPSDIGDKSKWTVYHVVDPASARNYVSIWAAVNEKREVVVLREWPDRDTYGPWAEFGDPKWKFGPASKKAGYNVQGYVDLFKEIEHELGVEVGVGCRIGDSRFFAAENEENVDLFTSFSECGMDFVPSDGRHEDIGITKMDEYFHYNPNVEVDAANKPLMTIHKDCGNTIYSIMNYGQNGKKDEPLKDFIDIPRYLVLANGGEGPMHFGPNSLKQKAQGGAY